MTRREGTAAERRARLDAIFGDVLPDTTSDERDPGTPPRGDDDTDDDTNDAWLRAQVPPHHG